MKVTQAALFVPVHCMYFYLCHVVAEEGIHLI